MSAARSLAHAAALILPVALSAVLFAAPAVAGPAAYDAVGDVQVSTIDALPPRAGAGVIIDFDLLYTAQRAGGPTTPTEVDVRYPRGMVWNGRRFPRCAPSALRTHGTGACPAGSLFARGYALAAGLRLPIAAFIGTRVHHHDTQLFEVQPPAGPAVTLVGELIPRLTSRYGLAEPIDLRGVPGGVVITEFHLTDLRRELRDGTPLTQAPLTCAGAWAFAVTSRFAGSSSLTSTNRMPCVS